MFYIISHNVLHRRMAPKDKDEEKYAVKFRYFAKDNWCEVDRIYMIVMWFGGSLSGTSFCLRCKKVTWKVHLFRTISMQLKIYTPQSITAMFHAMIRVKFLEIASFWLSILYSHFAAETANFNITDQSPIPNCIRRSP